MAALDKDHLHGNLLAFFKKHIQKTIATCSRESEYSWNSWREQVDPVIEVSEALGIDAEELKRAKEAYVNAQMHLLHVKQEHILKLKGGTLLMMPFYKEDLT
jgi:hypothetical protein